jgi:hypothetical protein
MAVVTVVRVLAAAVPLLPSEVKELSLSEHGVVVRCALGYWLQYVPVLYHLAFLQAEDVRYGSAAVFR